MAASKNYNQISKLLSLILRHQPEIISIRLDEGGWVEVDRLLAALRASHYNVTLDDLWYVVDNSEKKRFSFNNDKTRIRANQGHSVQVDLGLEPQRPPAMLYHGTAVQFADKILQEGLIKMDRHHVHLSADAKTAFSVGTRHGRPVLFRIDSERMASDGYTFYQSVNGVWLTDHIPPRYLIEELS